VSEPLKLTESVWMGRGDPFAYWYSDKPLPGGVERKCTREELEELVQLSKALERRQQLLRDIGKRQ
jgi:hypothetical protein